MAAGAGVVVVLAVAGCVAAYLALVASLPLLDGEVIVTGLSAPVVIERDARGVPTVSGADRLDVARATGFLHAQDRFFQMDLLRRAAAGELADLLGAAAVEADRWTRRFRLREVARRVMDDARDPDRDLVRAYTGGVNAALESLGARPFEYFLLRSRPSSWLPEDTVLVFLSMFLDLNDTEGRTESALGLMHDMLPPDLFAFLAPRGTEWDAPVVGDPFVVPPIPGPDVFDTRAARRSPAAARIGPAGDAPSSGGSVLARLPWPGGDPEAGDQRPGSNNWAVAGRLARDGGALLANDMHLGLSVPNIWYRARLAWGEGGRRREVAGVTLPGAPSLVVGSNGRVAWGFTNSNGDWSDLVVLDLDPDDPEVYLTPGGPRRLDRVQERIRVHGAPEETLDVVSTIWGPVIDKDHKGRPRALRWTGMEPRAVNLGLLRLETMADLDEAIEAAPRIGVPPLNLVAADASGRIGWTIIGAIPRRVGFDGRLPESWADGSRRWDGWLEPREYPRVVDPPSGRLWTANARVVEGEMLSLIGDGGYELGARARQIRDGLTALESATARDLLAIQLDDRAVFLQRWRDLLLEVLDEQAVAGDPRRAEMRRHVTAWGARAAVDSVGYRLVRAWRSFLSQQVFTALTALCRQADEGFTYARVSQSEGPLWSLVTHRPAHLLDPRHATWRDQMLAAADAALERLGGEGLPLSGQTWGRRNTVSIRHPLSDALPFGSGWLDVAPEPLPGDEDMPRVQGVRFGASERLVVSPGRERDGLLHMPVGQSAHPLSPHYRDSHPAWSRGEPTPFLPGPPAHALTLRPPA